jgi:hypothetical protein
VKTVRRIRANIADDGATVTLVVSTVGRL